jgi:hypothetical protein
MASPPVATMSGRSPVGPAISVCAGLSSRKGQRRCLLPGWWRAAAETLEPNRLLAVLLRLAW